MHTIILLTFIISSSAVAGQLKWQNLFAGEKYKLSKDINVSIDGQVKLTINKDKELLLVEEDYLSL